MAIPEGYRNNFTTLQRASANGDLCLVECRDAMTGQPVYALCAVNRDDEMAVDLASLARLFDGNPYEELVPPGLGEEED